MIGHPHLVEPTRYLRNAKERFDLGGEDKDTAGPKIVERLNPHVIPGAGQFLTPLVPDCKGEVAQKFLRAAFAPLPVGAKDQFTIADLLARAGGDAKSRYELIPVVEANVGGEYEVSALPHQGELLVERFRGRPEHPVTETDGTFAPRALSVRPSVGNASYHPFQN